MADPLSPSLKVTTQPCVNACAHAPPGCAGGTPPEGKRASGARCWVHSPSCHPESLGPHRETAMGTSARRDLWGPVATIPNGGSRLEDPTPQAELSLTHRSQDMMKWNPWHGRWPALRCTVSARNSLTSASAPEGPELPQGCPEGPAGQGAPTAHREACGLAGDDSG